MENKAFKARVAPVVGALNVLKAVGFTKVRGGRFHDYDWDAV